MSNNATNGGLRLYRGRSTQAMETCIALSGDSTVLGKGDAVKISAAGATSVGAGPTVQAVTRAAAGDAIYGVCEGFMQHWIDGTGSMNLGQTHRPASTAMYVLVRPASYEDEYTISDDGSAAMTKANIGNNANLVVAAASTTTGMSNMQLDATTAASGNATRQLKILGVVADATNDPASTGARWIVSLNNIYRGGSTGTVGV